LYAQLFVQGDLITQGQHRTQRGNVILFAYKNDRDRLVYFY